LALAQEMRITLFYGYPVDVQAPMLRSGPKTKGSFMKDDSSFLGSNETDHLPLHEIEPWPEPVDGKLLLDALVAVLKRFVVLPKYGAETLALWVLHTYAFLLRNISTYIGIESPQKQCGKTTLLTLLSQLACRPEIAANISPSAFFRVIEETRPTLLIDEGDTFLKRHGELRGILNAGYTRDSAYVVRVAAGVRNAECKTENEGQERQNRGSRLVRFSCFCPKAIAAIGRLPETLADRCIVIRMQRKTAAEACERSRSLDVLELKRKCVRFVSDHAEEIANARPDITSGLSDRTVDIWEPLHVLAQLAGGEWPEMARQAMAALAASAQERNPIGSLFLDILLCFTEAKADRLFSRTLAAGLDRFVERPWAELRKGKEITGPLLGRVLRPYGVRSRTIWIGNEAAKGYLMEDFEDAFKRYIPRSEWEALKAEWRVEEEGRKAAGAGGKPDGAGQSGEGSDQKPEAGTNEQQPGAAPEDDAAAA